MSAPPAAPAPEAPAIPRKLAGHSLSAGRPWPLGATFMGDGVNFAVFSAYAEAIDLCLLSPDGSREAARIPLCERDGDVWHVFVAGLMPGALYGYRVHGPYDPANGHRFNPNKLLIDPYAKKLAGALKWSDALMGYRVGDPQGDLSFDPRDSAPFMPRSEVVDPGFDWRHDVRPRIRRSEMVLCEANVRGMTMRHPEVAEALRGSFLGLASDPVLEHLVRLGVTTVQLMPVHAFIDERFLARRGLRNYWGYNTIGFFAPEPRYLSHGQIREVQAMVCRFHAAGLEVVLDVVYNHTAEGDHLGPTLAFRGLDNRSYYRLEEDARYYTNHTGTGNSLNLSHPMVLRMVMDSLRYWVETYHVDGFRFDLGTTLAREDGGFDPRGGFLDAVAQDPVLAGVKLITEPWDLGPGGYRLGAFPHPFLEFNDRFRDEVRRFWKGEAGVAELSNRLSGSAPEFDHSGRSASSSVNFVTVHDGFTLHDLAAYSRKHNEANGEDNRDGADENHSENLGVEGPTDDPDILAARARRVRNLLATVLLAQGTPFLLSGDEIGNTQGGNNNAFAQDNETGWIDWSAPDTALFAFARRLIALRRAHPVLRQKLFLHAHERARDGKPDLFWHLPDGRAPTEDDWNRADWRCLCAEFRTASATPDYAASDEVVFLVLNGGEGVTVRLPEPVAGRGWRRALDTAAPETPPEPVTGTTAPVAAQSVVVFVPG